MMESENNRKNTSNSYEEAFSSFINRSTKRLRRQPSLIFPALFAYIRGLYYRMKFLLLFKKIRIGAHFRVYGRLTITGPGSVILGKDCLILSQMTKPVCITTQLSDSRVIIGDHVGLNGTSIVCFDEIVVDDYSNIADAYITDSSSHPLSADRRLYSALDIPVEKVHIGKNVWISTHVVILKGVRIGENSVIGAFSLVNKSLPMDILAAGIPAKPIKKLPDEALLKQDG
jgi:acetyltransferase-like isoleucine patch superfamily enzyme